MSTTTSLKNTNIEIDSLKNLWITSNNIQIDAPAIQMNTGNLDLGSSKLQFNSNVVVIGDVSSAGSTGNMNGAINRSFDKLITININGVDYVIPASEA